MWKNNLLKAVKVIKSELGSGLLLLWLDGCSSARGGDWLRCTLLGINFIDTNATVDAADQSASFIDSRSFFYMKINTVSKLNTVQK